MSEDKIKIEVGSSGYEYTVTKGNLILHQTILNGQRFNTCLINRGDYLETIPIDIDLCKELFIALHNFKNQ